MNQQEHNTSEIVAGDAATEGVVTVVEQSVYEGQFSDISDQTLADVSDANEAKRVLEAALLAAFEPMGINELKRLFEGFAICSMSFGSNGKAEALSFRWLRAAIAFESGRSTNGISSVFPMISH
jgi:hypothetical protein